MALQMRIAVLREQIAQRARYWLKLTVHFFFSPRPVEIPEFEDFLEIWYGIVTMGSAK
jgi:hypothetical protein